MRTIKFKIDKRMDKLENTMASMGITVKVDNWKVETASFEMTSDLTQQEIDFLQTDDGKQLIADKYNEQQNFAEILVKDITKVWVE